MSYHGMGQLRMPSGGFAPSGTPTLSTARSAVTGALSLTGEQNAFKSVRALLPLFAQSLRGVSVGRSAMERSALRQRASGVDALAQTVNRVGTLYPAGWSRAQIDRLVTISRSPYLPIDADLALGGTVAAQGRLIRQHWAALVGSLRKKGQWPSSLVAAPLKTALPKAPTAAEVAAEQERRRRAEAEMAAARTRAAEEERRAREAEAEAEHELMIEEGAPEYAPVTPPPYVPPTTPGPITTEEAASTPTRRIPWVWILGGTAALGGGYLVWRGMKK